MDGHSTAPGRSRSSQSPSPSHSASASATSSIHKRKMASEEHVPPFPSSFDGALTSNDDLESISARGGGADSDSEEDSEEVGDDEEEEYDDSAMRNFTASRLENSGGPTPSGRNNNNNKLNKTEKIEPAEVVKEGNVPPTTSVTGGAVVKEESMKNIFTDNLQTSGAYTAREESLKREEESGRLKFVCVSNDCIDEHMIWLIGLKNIFARQLPNMPKEYIVRLVMDRNHKSVMVIRRNLVVGGITYRPYTSQKFGEIAFCAITADEQVKGYGTRLMNHLKLHARDVDGLTHFLTYADNNAVGYFVKQGFTKEIYLGKEHWQGYIKDYDGGILMECKIDPKLPYTDLSTMIRRQRQAIDEKIRELSNCHIVYPGIDFQKAKQYRTSQNRGNQGGGCCRRLPPKCSYCYMIGHTSQNRGNQGGGRCRRLLPKCSYCYMIGHTRVNCYVIGHPGMLMLLRSTLQKEAGIPKKAIKVEDIPGLREAGWTPDQYGHSRFKTVNSLSDQKSLTAFMRSLLKIMHDHPDSWPFKEPVDARDVPDYYDIIKDPIDLKTMSKRVESELYYATFDMFVADLRRMFANARTYNSPETIYYKCATRLESHFSNKVQTGLQPGIKIQ